MDCRDQELLQEATWGYRQGTDSGENKEIKSTGVDERLITGVRERELAKMCTWVKGGPNREAWVWRVGYKELSCIG